MLDTCANILCKHTKWSIPQKNEKGEYHFVLENSMDFFIFSPNGQDIVFSVHIAPVPHDNADGFLLDIAQKAAGMYKIKKSVVSLQNMQIILHRIVGKNTVNEENILQNAKEILNEADIWHTALNRNQAAGSSFSFTPFSFSSTLFK